MAPLHAEAVNMGGVPSSGNSTRISSSLSSTELYSQGSPVLTANMPPVPEGAESTQPWTASVVTGQTRPVRSATATSSGTLPEQRIFPGVMQASLRRDSGVDNSIGGGDSNGEDNSDQMNDGHGDDHDHDNEYDHPEGIDWSSLGQVNDSDDSH